jgi:hypothetical protein
MQVQARNSKASPPFCNQQELPGMQYLQQVVAGAARRCAKEARGLGELGEPMLPGETISIMAPGGPSFEAPGMITGRRKTLIEGAESAIICSNRWSCLSRGIHAAWRPSTEYMSRSTCAAARSVVARTLVPAMERAAKSWAPNACKGRHAISSGKAASKEIQHQPQGAGRRKALLQGGGSQGALRGGCPWGRLEKGLSARAASPERRGAAPREGGLRRAPAGALRGRAPVRKATSGAGDAGGSTGWAKPKEVPGLLWHGLGVQHAEGVAALLGGHLLASEGVQRPPQGCPTMPTY